MSVSHPRRCTRSPSPAPRALGDPSQRLLPRKREASASSPPPPKKNITTSMTSFINKLRPSKRPEKGSTARVTTTTTDQSRENHSDNGGERTASASQPQQRVNSISRHNPDAIPSSLWRTPISLPRRAHSTKEIIDNGTMSSTPQFIPRKKVPSPSRGQNRMLKRLGEEDGIPLISSPEPAVTQPSSHSRDIFAAKQELRRQRRNLKQSGDFLGVTGINPYTGQMDVITPTTSSEDATPYPSPTAPRPINLDHTPKDAAEENENSRRETRLKKEHDGAEKRKDEMRTILDQHGGNAMWQRKESAWSSIAAPNLSPIPQSQRSGSVRETDSEDAVQRSPVNRSPNPSPNRGPFLGMPAVSMRSSPHRSAAMRDDMAMLAIPRRQLGKSVPSTKKENAEPAAANSSSSRPRTIRFSLPPLMHRRSGHGLQETSRYQDDQWEPQAPAVHRVKGHRYSHSLPDMKGLQRMNDGSVLKLDNMNPSDQWASRLMQDLGCSEASNQSNNTTGLSVQTASSTSTEEIIRDRSVSTPITITTGSECSRSPLILKDDCGETTKDFKQTILTPLPMSTPSTTVFSPSTSSLSLAERPSSIFSDLPGSPIEMQLSAWPSIESRSLHTMITSIREMVPVPPSYPREAKTPPPLSPEPEQESVTMSSVVSHEGDITRYSRCVLTESRQSPQPVQWSMRKTMRKKADDDEEEEEISGMTTPEAQPSLMSTSTYLVHHQPPHPSPPKLTPEKADVGLDHAMARGAARAAFTHLMTTSITKQDTQILKQSSDQVPTNEPNSPTSLPRQQERRAVPAPVSDRESPRRAGPEARRDLAFSVMMTLAGNTRLVLLRKCLGTLCKWVRVVLEVGWWMVQAYWDLVSPMFDGESGLRKRLAGENEAEMVWDDWFICAMALVFMFGGIVVTVWTLRGFVWAGWVMCKIAKGMWRVLGV